VPVFAEFSNFTDSLFKKAIFVRFTFGLKSSFPQLWKMRCGDPVSDQKTCKIVAFVSGQLMVVEVVKAATSLKPLRHKVLTKKWGNLS